MVCLPAFTCLWQRFVVVFCVEYHLCFNILSQICNQYIFLWHVSCCAHMAAAFFGAIFDNFESFLFLFDVCCNGFSDGAARVSNNNNLVLLFHVFGWFFFFRWLCCVGHRQGIGMYTNTVVAQLFVRCLMDVAVSASNDIGFHLGIHFTFSIEGVGCQFLWSWFSAGRVNSISPRLCRSFCFAVAVFSGSFVLRSSRGRLRFAGFPMAVAYTMREYQGRAIFSVVIVIVRPFACSLPHRGILWYIRRHVPWTNLQMWCWC